MQVLAFELDPDDRADGQKLLIEAGLLVSFMVDGGVEELERAHRAFRQALARDGLRPEHVEALEAALRSNRDALVEYARLD